MKKIIFVLIIVVLGFILYEGYYKTAENKFEEGCEHYRGSYWANEFLEYYSNNDKQEKAQNLTKNMDEISVEYVNQFLKNSYYLDKCVNKCKGYSWDNLWSKYDKKLFKEFEKMEVPSSYPYNPFIYKNLYGMKDLPKEVLDGINGKDIIDVGAAPGDTTYTFHKYFPKSNIYAYEPIEDYLQNVVSMENVIKEEESECDLIHPIQKGVGAGEYIADRIEFHKHSDNVEIVSLDYDYPQIGNNDLGLIKMDIEGMETEAIQGAESIIKQYRPVLVIAMYHTPHDFFELKDMIKEINPDYKFMIRRSEDFIPDGDLVLIAY